MMKILFLHGAIKNSGDFLISLRSQNLIKYTLPNCEIDALWEGENEQTIQSHLKDKDGVVFGGGPFFTHHIHPGDIPFVSNLDSFGLPMLNIGGGWYGPDYRYESVANYEMDHTSMKLLKKIEASAGCLSCRDWYTVNMLKSKGFKAEMHGCPAWYDIENVGSSTLRKVDGIKKICISDPANVNNSKAAVNLIDLLKKLYPAADMTYVFHRGAWEKEEGKRGELRRTGIEPTLKKNRIRWVNIAGGCEGFSIYDDCDLHIGFRVHAHIYNLSKRNRTVLLEEDGRGAGVNQALGLGNIHVYNDRRQFKPELAKRLENKLFPSVNTYLKDEILRNIERNDYTDWIEYELAFKRMQFYFEQLIRHISKIKDW